MNKAYFQYYETFEIIVQKFHTVEEQNAFRNKIINYGLYGQEPEELSKAEDFVWDLVKDMIDDQKHRREVNRANRTKKTAEPIHIEVGTVPDREEADIITPPAEEKPKTKKFVKPTVEEVKNYCEQRKNGINPQGFVDYYEARGWKIGSNSMKDWKAAVRTWETRTKTNYSPSGGYWPEDKLML